MGFPRSLRPMLDVLPYEAQRSLLADYRKRRKSLLFAYLAWLLLGWHYLYLRRVGLQFAFWLTLGGLLVWWLVDLFRVMPMVNRLNEDNARDLLVAYRAIYAPVGTGSGALGGAATHDVADTFSQDEPELSYTLVFIFTIAGLAALIGIASFLYSRVHGPAGMSYEASTPQSTYVADGSQIEPVTASAWIVAETNDPMTDARVVSASRDIQGDRFLVQATVKCVNGKSLIYEFSTFDSDSSGVPMTSAPDATAMVMMKSGLAPFLTGGSPLITSMIRFQVRADDAKARTGYIFDPKIDHRIVIGPRTLGVKSVDLAAAARLLIRLPTQGGDETVVIDQHEANLASVIQSCSAGQSTPNGSADAKIPNSTAIEPVQPDEPTSASNHQAENVMEAPAAANIMS